MPPYKYPLKNEKCPEYSAEYPEGGPWAEGSPYHSSPTQQKETVG